MASIESILRARRASRTPTRRPVVDAFTQLAKARRQARTSPESVRSTFRLGGVNVPTGGTRQPGRRDDVDVDALIAAILAGQGGGFGGGGGGGGGRTQADEIAFLREQSRLGGIAAKDQRDFDAEQARIAQAIEDKRIADALEERRQSDIRGLQGERQSRFVDLIGRDQARAVLFALGLGPQADIFTARASQLESTLPALKGARTLELETEAALAQLLGKDIDIGAKGVSGLGPAQGAATAFQRGGLSAQQLLASAFGVGDLGTGRQPGIGADELLRIVQSVTPRGNL